MKRLLLAIALVLLLAGTAGADSFYALRLYLTGVGSEWNTLGGQPVLGVSSDPGGPLMNSVSPYNIPTLGDGVYYLYAGNYWSQWFEGNTVTIRFYGSKPGDPDNPYRLDQMFGIVGATQDTFQLWTPGYISDWSWPGPPPALPTIYLGWAGGSPDLMGGFPGPDGSPDAYLVLGFNQEPTAAVPVPPTLLMLGSGLIGLVGWRRFRKS